MNSGLLPKLAGGTLQKLSTIPGIPRVLAHTSLQTLSCRWSLWTGFSGAYVPPRSGREPTFLIRVDDFPAWDCDTEDFREFHELLSSKRIPYLLGVTPFLAIDPLDPLSTTERSLTPSEIVMLRQVTANGVDLALHGFTHRIRGRRLRSELIGMSETDLRDKLDRAIAWFCDVGLAAPIAFIPPFNTVTTSEVRTLSSYLPTLCGGPESLRSLGFYPTPCRVEGVTYWQSLQPAYGKAVDVAQYARLVLKRCQEVIVPLTIHWRWERADGWKGVKDLTKVVAGKVTRWRALENAK